MIAMLPARIVHSLSEHLASKENRQHTADRSKVYTAKPQPVGAHNIQPKSKVVRLRGSTLQSPPGRQQSCWSSGLRVLDRAEMALQG